LSLSSQYKVITSPLGDGLHKDGKRLTPQRLKVLIYLKILALESILALKRFMKS